MAISCLKTEAKGIIIAMTTKLRRKINAMQLSQTALAKRLNAKVTTINMSVLNGIKTTRVAKRYAEALGCDWRDLLD